MPSQDAHTSDGFGHFEVSKLRGMEFRVGAHLISVSSRMAKFIKFEGLDDSGLIVTFSLLSLGSQLMNDALSSSLTAE